MGRGAGWRVRGLRGEGLGARPGVPCIGSLFPHQPQPPGPASLFEGGMSPPVEITCTGVDPGLASPISSEARRGAGHLPEATGSLGEAGRCEGGTGPRGWRRSAAEVEHRGEEGPGRGGHQASESGHGSDARALWRGGGAGTPPTPVRGQAALSGARPGLPSLPGRPSSGAQRERSPGPVLFRLVVHTVPGLRPPTGLSVSLR